MYLRRNNFFHLFTIVFLAILLLVVYNINTTAKNLLYKNHNGAPVPIFYGLNESHSNSWAQIAPNGKIGIVYFQTDSTNSTEGSLFFKTIEINGAEKKEVIANGERMEISVLLFTKDSSPHIFVANSDNINQHIKHYFKNDAGEWDYETIIEFNNEGGKFIYELSADIDKEDNYHLLILKTRSNPDSYDYYRAFLNSHLFYLTNSSGVWQKELIHNFDMFYTSDEYSKMMNRQDIKVDGDGYIHIIFGEQINGLSNASPCRLRYATNKNKAWEFETALNYQKDSRHSAGWYPSLALDNSNNPFISCAYITRVPTGSASSSKLMFLSRNADNIWQTEIVENQDDGYHGQDGRRYTGALTHLVFDKQNNPHILFSDIASSHARNNYFNIGNIRYAVKENGLWIIKTIYKQPSPTAPYNAIEMYDQCILVNDKRIVVVGQELMISSADNYECKLISFEIEKVTNLHINKNNIGSFKLEQNYPNPFNPSTIINYQIPETAEIEVVVYDCIGNKIVTLIDKVQAAGNYSYNYNASDLASGIYIYKLRMGDNFISRKMVLMK